MPQDTPKPDISFLAGSEWGFEGQSDRFVKFENEGRVIGSGGCNNFFGDYQAANGAITIGPIAGTKKMCPPDIMKAEDSLVGGLQMARRFEATHTVLILRDDNGTTLLTLQRRDWD